MYIDQDITKKDLESADSRYCEELTLDHDHLRVSIFRNFDDVSEYVALVREIPIDDDVTLRPLTIVFEGRKLYEIMHIVAALLEIMETNKEDVVGLIDWLKVEIGFLQEGNDYHRSRLFDWSN